MQQPFLKAAGGKGEIMDISDLDLSPLMTKCEGPDGGDIRLQDFASGYDSIEDFWTPPTSRPPTPIAMESPELRHFAHGDSEGVIF